MKMDASPCYLQLGRRQDAIREANGPLAAMRGPGRGQENMDMPETVGATGRENTHGNGTAN